GPAAGRGPSPGRWPGLVVLHVAAGLLVLGTFLPWMVLPMHSLPMNTNGFKDRRLSLAVGERFGHSPAGWESPPRATLVFAGVKLPVGVLTLALAAALVPLAWLRLRAAALAVAAVAALVSLVLTVVVFRAVQVMRTGLEQLGGQSGDERFEMLRQERIAGSMGLGLWVLLAAAVGAVVGSCLLRTARPPWAGHRAGGRAAGVGVAWAVGITPAGVKR